MYKLFIDSSLIRKQKQHICSEVEFSMDMLYVLKGMQNEIYRIPIRKGLLYED